MNKRLPFIALLIGMEWGLSQVTFGTVDILTSFIAISTLRRKDFFIYLLVSSPSFVVTYIQYGAFYATSSGNISYNSIAAIIYFAVFFTWHPLLVNLLLIPYCVWTLFTTRVQHKLVGTLNTIRKQLDIKPRLYPEIKFRQKIRKKLKYKWNFVERLVQRLKESDFGDKIAFLMKGSLVFMMAISIFLLVLGNIMFFSLHQFFVVKGAPYINCWQFTQNQTFISEFTNGTINAVTQPMPQQHLPLQMNQTILVNLMYHDFLSVMNCH